MNHYYANLYSQQQEVAGDFRGQVPVEFDTRRPPYGGYGYHPYGFHPWGYGGYHPYGVGFHPWGYGYNPYGYGGYHGGYHKDGSSSR
nr:hypothetical protein [Tumebacillus amylolyticus]